MDLSSPASLLLLLDTCGNQGSVALVQGDTLLAEEALPERMASAAVLPAVRQALRIAGVDLDDLTGLGVVSGPGSFTGLRVGLAVAKGLAEAVDLPLAAVSRLAVLADAAGLQEGFVALHAGPGQLYLGTVQQGRCVAEHLVTTLASQPILGGSKVVFAELSLQQQLESSAGSARLVLPTARHSLRLVQVSLKRGGTDRATVDANYVRDEASIYARSNHL